MRELEERELPKSPSFRSQLVEKFTAVLEGVQKVKSPRF